MVSTIHSTDYPSNPYVTHHQIHCHPYILPPPFKHPPADSSQCHFDIFVDFLRRPSRNYLKCWLDWWNFFVTALSLYLIFQTSTKPYSDYRYLHTYIFNSLLFTSPPPPPSPFPSPNTAPLKHTLCNIHVKCLLTLRTVTFCHSEEQNIFVIFKFSFLLLFQTYTAILYRISMLALYKNTCFTLF